MSKRGGLGRGLAALIPTAPATPAPAPAAAPAPVLDQDDAARVAEDRPETSAAAEETAAAGTAAPTVTLVPPPATPLFGAPAATVVEDGPVGIPGAQLREVSVDDVVPNPKQPRQVFDDEALEELTHSVKEFGLLQPIVVRERTEGGYELIMGERRLRAARAADLATVPAIVRDTTDDALLRDALLENIHRVQLNPLEELTYSVREFGLLQPIVVREAPGGGYELIMGERRLRAARAADLETVPAIVRDTTDDAMLRDALLENIHRVQLNPLEEAAAYQQLLEEFGATHEELAGRIGRSRSQVTNTIRLMKLPVKVQTRVAAGVISAGHARALLGLPDADAQDALATRIVAEGMSVRATEEAVAMAAAAQPTAKRRARNISAPGVEELGSRLSDMFETKVKIQIGRSKGKIVVEFGSVDDLQRIIGVMAPEITGRRPDA